MISPGRISVIFSFSKRVPFSCVPFRLRSSTFIFSMPLRWITQCRPLTDSAGHTKEQEGLRPIVFAPSFSSKP